MENQTTKTKAWFSRYMKVEERPENEGIGIVPEVEERRSANEILHLLRDINKNTSVIPGLVQSLKNLFSFGVSELDRHVEKKPKK